MSFQLKEGMLIENKKSELLDRIMAKYKECNKSDFLQIAINHFKIYEKYLKSLDEKGPAAFPNRLEYQKFEVAKLFIDRINLLNFSLDPSFKGYKKYKDKTMPPLDAFNMTSDVKETRKMKFYRSIENGDILHVRVVKEDETDYKLLVINKYDDNERVADYLFYVYILKSPQLEKLEIGDYIRAAVLGKCKMEENVFKKLLVSLNTKLINNNKYKDVELGRISKSEIDFYPEDISKHRSFVTYMMAEKDIDYPQEIIKSMTTLGLDPYKIYTFDKSRDGKKLGKPKKIDSLTRESMIMEKSMDVLKEVEKKIVQGMCDKDALPLAMEALKIYPQNDAAYAIIGQVWNSRFLSERQTKYFVQALHHCKKAFELNPFNLTATRVYLTDLLLSAELYKEDGNKEKADEIEEVLKRHKYVCDVSKLWEEDKRKQSPTEETQSAIIPMDTSNG